LFVSSLDHSIVDMLPEMLLVLFLTGLYTIPLPCCVTRRTPSLLLFDCVCIDLRFSHLFTVAVSVPPTGNRARSVGSASISASASTNYDIWALFFVSFYGTANYERETRLSDCRLLLEPISRNHQ